ncbi:hypothetical protein BHM03_00060326, partial [Ensete ventricosum]
WFSRPSESKPNVRTSPTNSSAGTLTYWRKSVPTPIFEHWLIEELSPKSITVGYTADTSKMGDLVLRKIEVIDPTRSRGKLAPNWEGPYRVIDVIRDRTYTLATMEGRVLPRT